MPSVESGLEGPGIEPKPEVEDIESDKGFTRALRAQPGGESLPASGREMGAPNSPHRKAWVQDKLNESQKLVDQQLRNKDDFDAYMTSNGAGAWQDGLEVPDDSPPAPALVVDTAEVDRLKSELTAARGSLSEAQQHEATMLAYDALEDATDETEVHNTLSELREALPAEQWDAFKLDAIGGGLVEPEELAQHEAQYSSERAFEQAFDQASKSAAEMEKLAKDQEGVLEAEQKRLGLNEDAWTPHLLNVAEAAWQMGIDLASLPKDEYETELKGLSALVADTGRAYRHAAFQEELLGSSTSVEDGLTIAGQPLNPREPIEPRLDFGRKLTHQNRGKTVDVAAGVLAEEKKSTSKADDIAALARKTDRDIEAKQARARKMRGGF